MDESELIAAVARYHKIDVPVMAIRVDGEHVVIVIQGGAELKCKLSQLKPETVEKIKRVSNTRAKGK